jgi:hypothetical protein
MAGRQGLEPRYADPESAVLPLDDLPKVQPQCNKGVMPDRRSLLGDVKGQDREGWCEIEKSRHRNFLGAEPARIFTGWAHRLGRNSLCRSVCLALRHYPGTEQTYHHDRNSRYIEWAKSPTHFLPSIRQLPIHHPCQFDVGRGRLASET